MALRVQEFPSVAPLPTPPDDYQRINATPEAFGGISAAALQRFGGQFEQSSAALTRTALDRQEFFNQVANDDGFNDLQDKYHTITYGDPNDPTKPGIYGLHGRDALEQGPVAFAALKAAREQIRGRLQNDRQRMLFDQSSRRLEMFTRDAIGRHLDQQANVYALATNKASEDIALRGISSTWNSEDAFQNNLAEGISGAVKRAQVQYGQNLSPEMLQSTIADFKAKAIATRALAWGANDLGAAAAWLEQHQGDMDAGRYIAIKHELETRGTAADVNARVQSIMGGSSAPTPLASAIRGQEGSRADQTSPKGAVGTMQVTPAFFQTYARRGESFDNEADRVTVANRGINALETKYDGDAQRVAVAYFSGEKNVAPPGSPTPWIENKSDGHTTVAQYVAGVMGRLPGRAENRESLIPDRYMSDAAKIAEAEKQAATMDPKAGRLLVDTVYTEIARKNALQDRALAAAEKARRDAAQDAGNAVVQQLIKDPTKFDPNTIADNPNLDYTQKWSLYQMAQHAMKGDTDHDVKTYGPGFYSLYQQIHAPQGDPNRLTDPTQLYSHVGPNGDLTVSGVEKLTQEIVSRRTPDGEAEAEMRKQFLATARQEIVRANPLLRIRDPRGEELFLKFLATALPAYDAGRKAGLSPQQLLNPDSKDYVGASIPQFRRPTAVWMKDLVQDDPVSQAMHEQEQQPATPAAPQFTRQQYEDEMRRRGLLPPVPVNPGSLVPH